MKRYLFFSSFFRFFIELSLEATFSVIVNILLASIESYGDVASIATGCTFLLVNALVLFYLPWKIRQIQQTEDKKNEYYDDFLEELELKESIACLYHHAFVHRRLIFVVMVFLLADYLAV